VVAFAHQPRDAEILRRSRPTPRGAHPQHRVLEIREADGGIEVCTTSQKVAHRIAHEPKAFGGHARYRGPIATGGCRAWNA
jgi:hypothetical protein